MSTSLQPFASHTTCGFAAAGADGGGGGDRSLLRRERLLQVGAQCRLSGAVA
tara:strand:+ start:2806 stop:2961 length:156 start_codon:yes stop_codon:yes gene_type:complete